MGGGSRWGGGNREDRLRLLWLLWNLLEPRPAGRGLPGGFCAGHGGHREGLFPEGLCLCQASLAGLPSWGLRELPSSFRLRAWMRKTPQGAGRLWTGPVKGSRPLSCPLQPSACAPRISRHFSPDRLPIRAQGLRATSCPPSRVLGCPGPPRSASAENLANDSDSSVLAVQTVSLLKPSPRRRQRTGLGGDPRGMEVPVTLGGVPWAFLSCLHQQ